MKVLLLPIFPTDMTSINSLLGFCRRGDNVYYFYGTMNPIFQHHVDDQASFDMINSQFYVRGEATQAEICRAFGVPQIRMKRAAKIYREQGIKGFYSKERKSTCRILSPEIIEKAEEMLYQGLKAKEIAEKLDIKCNTIHKAIKSGKIKKKLPT